MKKSLIIAVLIVAINISVTGASISKKTIAQPSKEFIKKPSLDDIQAAIYDFELYLSEHGKFDISEHGSKESLSYSQAFASLPPDEKRMYVFAWLINYVGDPRPAKGTFTNPENKKKFRAAYEMLKKFSKPAKTSDLNYEESMAPINEAEMYIKMYHPYVHRWFVQQTNQWVEKELAKKRTHKPAPKKKVPAKKEKKLVPKAKEKRIIIREAAKAYEAGFRVPKPGVRAKVRMKKVVKKPVRAKAKPAAKHKAAAKKRVTSKRHGKKIKQSKRMKKRNR